MPQCRVTTLRQSWDEEAERWIHFARNPDFDHMFWRFGLHQFLDLLPKPGRLTIDVGCGEGRLTRILRDRGYRIAGVDGSETMIKAAASHGEAAPALVADAAHLPLKGRSADLVVSYMVLQDVDDVDNAIREAARVMGSGGRFCFAFTHPVQSMAEYADVPAELVHPYFVPRRISDTIRREDHSITFNMEHRPLERYAKALEDGGFLIETLREPMPDPEYLAQYPRAERWTRIPWAIFGRAIRALWAR